MIELRATRREDLPALSALFAARFGHPLAADEWEWKYRRLPGAARSLVAVAADGEVLAHAGALCLPARWQGGEAGAWQLADFAGVPRRSGLRPPLVALGRRLLADLPGAADVPFLFGFPSERHFRLGERVFGYRPLTALQPLAGPLAAVPAPPPGVAIETGDLCGPWAEAAWESCGVSGVRRSVDFLNWRYHARPGRYYRVYRLPRNSSKSQQTGALLSRSRPDSQAQEGEPPAVFPPRIDPMPPLNLPHGGGTPPSRSLRTEDDGALGGTPALLLPEKGERRSPAARPSAAGAVDGLAVFAFVGREAWAAELWLPGGAEWYASMLAVAADLRQAGLLTWRFWPRPGRREPALPAGGPAADPLLAALALAPDGEPRRVGCRPRPGCDPAAAAAGFTFSMGDYDLV